MRARLLLGAVGVVAAAYGGLLLLRLDLVRLVDALLWLAGGLVVHDAVVAPLTLAAAWVGSRVVPVAWRPRLTVALVVLLTVTATAVPVLGRFGARPDNPTLLDRDYVSGWLLVAAVVVAATLVVPLARGARRGLARSGP